MITRQPSIQDAKLYCMEYLDYDSLFDILGLTFEEVISMVEEQIEDNLDRFSNIMGDFTIAEEQDDEDD